MKAVLLISSSPSKEAFKLTAFLLTKGYIVSTVHSKQQGLQFLAKHPRATILIDQKLPEHKSLSLLDLLKTIAPDSAIVFLAEQPTIEQAVRFLNHGAYDYLLKPCKPEDIEQILNRIPESLEMPPSTLVKAHLLVFKNWIKSRIDKTMNRCTKTVNLHVVPIKKDGGIDLKNAQVLCLNCAIQNVGLYIAENKPAKLDSVTIRTALEAAGYQCQCIKNGCH